MSDWWTERIAVLGSGRGLSVGCPVYHRPRPFNEVEKEDEEGNPIWRHRTRCGLIYSEWVGVERRVGKPRLLLAHAQAIGRPCQRCYPVPRS